MNSREEGVDCIVIGAGPAGLAAAHELMGVGRSVLVLEKGARVAMSWRTHREGLRLHTVRRLSGLPGLTIPREDGRYVSSANLVRYLERYTSLSGIAVRYGVVVSRVERTDDAGPGARWTIGTASGEVYRAATVVVATGYNQLPFTPAIPGLDGFTTPTLHVSEYAGNDQFAGRDVLVIGAGNAAAEAATELAAAGARRIRMAVRTTPHIVRRRVWGLSMQRVAIIMSIFPTGLADRAAALLARLTVPDLSARGLSRPKPNLYTRVDRDQSVPVHDTGIVALVASGAVEPVAAVTGFEPGSVRLADGSILEPDVVIFATGYRRGLERMFEGPELLDSRVLLDGSELLDSRGDPRSRSGTEAAPGLYFVGFTVTATGALRQLSSDARRVARTERRAARGRAVTPAR